MPRFLLLVTLSLGTLLARTAGAAGQDSPWSVEAELGASVFFGSTSQSTVTTRVGAERSDSTFALTGQAGFAYGEATDASGDDFVAKRDWKLEGSLDWHPYAALSPFVFGSLESSLQRQIDLRFNGGAGGKLTLHRDERSRVDVSVALLAEQTRFRGVVDGRDTETRARWSTRLRAERDLLEGRVSIGTVNFYRPVFDELGEFVFESQSSVAFQLSEIITLKVSLVDTYDSGAVERGARSNNDGQFLFSILSSF